jgi:hypothetical protein
MQRRAQGRRWVVGVGIGPWVSRSAGARRSEMHDTRGVWRVALIRRMALGEGRKIIKKSESDVYLPDGKWGRKVPFF